MAQVWQRQDLQTGCREAKRNIVTESLSVIILILIILLLLYHIVVVIVISSDAAIIAQDVNSGMTRTLVMIIRVIGAVFIIC